MSIQAIKQTIGSGLNQMTNFNLNHRNYYAAIHLGLVAYGASLGDSYSSMTIYAALTNFGIIVANVGLGTLGIVMTTPAPAVIAPAPIPFIATPSSG